MNIILYQIFLSIISIRLCFFLLLNLSLKALKKIQTSVFQTTSHILCKPTSTQTNISYVIQKVVARWIHGLAKHAIIVCSLACEKVQFRRQISAASIWTAMDKKVSISVEYCKTLAFESNPN